MKTSKLSIDNKELLLAYDFNAIADAEESAGCNLLAALENLTNITATQLRGLLYAAIVSEPRLTLREAGDLVRVNTISVVTNALADAYNLTLAEEPAKGPAAEPPATPGLIPVE